VGSGALDLEQRNVPRGDHPRPAHVHVERVCGFPRDRRRHALRRTFGRLSPPADPPQLRVPEMARARDDLRRRTGRHGRADLDRLSSPVGMAGDDGPGIALGRRLCATLRQHQGGTSQQRRDEQKFLHGWRFSFHLRVGPHPQGARAAALEDSLSSRGPLT